MTALIEETLCLGGDPRGCSEFGSLTAELAKLNHPACPDVDWTSVEHLCLTVFREHGLELQSIAAFTLARAQLHGLKGLDDGLHLLNRLLIQDWERLWPPALPVRLEILAWLFTQLQPLLRRQALSIAHLPELSGVDEQLRQLSERLKGHAQVLLPLLALHKQLQAVIQRLARDADASTAVARSAWGAADEVKPATRKAVSTGDGATPAVVVLTLPESEAAPERRRRGFWPCLLALAAFVVLAGLFWWWAGAGAGNALLAAKFNGTPVPPPPRVAEPIRLDSLVLFAAGSAELKPESSKTLVNSLINIKAQPGWLILITGHSDATGDARQNLVLSQARAAAVREWMQRMGDIPNDCFVVRGAGASEPVESDDTDAGRNANRRVEISLIPVAGACEKG